MAKSRTFYVDAKDFYIDTPERVEIVKLPDGKRVAAKERKAGEEYGVQITLDDAVMEFSRIKKDLDIKSFAIKYGLLGINDKADMSHIDSYIESFQLDPHSTSERVDEWFYHADRFKRLLTLRKAYKENRTLTQIVSVSGPRFCWKVDNAPMLLPSKIFRLSTWNNGEHSELWYDTNIDEAGVNDDLLRSITPILIKDEIVPFIRSPLITVDVDTTEVVFKDQEKRYEGGFSFVLREQNVTVSLLVAMYFELFKLVNGDSNIGLCDVCGGPVLIKRSRGDGPCYCSAKCKVKKHSKGRNANG